MTLNLALIGCGGMGRRHIRGMHKLMLTGQQRFNLVAVCDVYEPNAELATDLATELLGTTPQRFTSITGAAAAIPDLHAVIITTAPDSHADIGIEALNLGLDVMVEKPIALTVSQALRLVEAGRQSGRTLAVAENYRRDPINRLAKAIVDAGIIGTPYLMIQSSSGSGEKVIITPWRHRKVSGGIVVDMGIHYADILEYFLGDIESVFANTSVVDQKRVDNEGVWHEADAEDLAVGTVRFASGAIGNLLIDLAGRGQGHFSRIIHGTDGSLAIPQDRTGNPLILSLRQDGSDHEIDQSELLNLVPGFRLDPVTAALFGGERLTTYDLPFADIDANLLAIEQADFADAITNSRDPEVDGAFGLRSLAIAYGLIESEHLGRPADIATMLQNVDTPYQSELDAAIAAK